MRSTGDRAEGLRFSVVVKPRCESTSFGLQLAHDRAHLAHAVENILTAYDQGRAGGGVYVFEIGDCGSTQRAEFGGNYDDRSDQAPHPLTTGNSALVLVDHQVGLLTGVRDYETGELTHNVVALAKAAKVVADPHRCHHHGPRQRVGPTFPELVEVVGGEHIIDRSSINAWDDP
jgi:hypothetical protein